MGAKIGMRSRVLFIVAALIAYGSLYPFHFTVPQLHAAAWMKLFSDSSSLTSRGDALGNLALFVPFGFAGVFALPGQSPPVRVVVLTFISLALAAVLQVAQIYFPPRTPAVADIFWNMVGTGLGMLAGLSLRNHIRLRWQAWEHTYTIPLSLIVLWIAAELLPLVPSLDLQSIKGSLKALLRLHMSPPDVLWHAAGVLVAGRALAAIFGAPRALQLLAVLVAVVIAGKVLIVTRVLNASTLIGLAIGYGVWRFMSKRMSGSDAGVLAVLLAAYTLKALEPFELRPVPAAFSWIPFASMLQGAMLINAEVLVESVFVFAGLLGLIRMQGSPVGASSVVLALWVAALEAAQVYIVGRSPDITEPLLVLLVGQILRHAPARTAPVTGSYTARADSGQSPTVL
jgi:VanZ family protein